MKEIIFDFFIFIVPVINYLFQVFKFNSTKSSKGFSQYLCLVTILLHTFKIFFWFKEKFKNTLLIQSIVVIIIQLYLIYLCVKYKEDTKNYQQIPNENENVSDEKNEINLKQEVCQLENILNL